MCYMIITIPPAKKKEGVVGKLRFPTTKIELLFYKYFIFTQNNNKNEPFIKRIKHSHFYRK